MNLRAIKLKVVRWLHPTDKEKAEIIRQISERLRYNRQFLKRSGTVWDDEDQAQAIAQSRRRRLKFWLNQRLISSEKRRIEPVAKWVYGADLFKIIERLSPTLEALGVIAIPLVLFFSAQSYQRSLLQQQTVTDYLNQLSSILLDVEGNLRAPHNEDLRALTTATTLTLLSDPNLDIARKSRVIQFLVQMGLVNRVLVYGPQLPKDMEVTLSLEGLNLGGANLRAANLSGANLKGVDLRNAILQSANLHGANLKHANLRGANLVGADLSAVSLPVIDLRSTNLLGANLRGTNLVFARLRNANLISVDLLGADLRDADLRGVDLLFANLHHADLRGADLRGANLGDAYLCETRLPITIASLNPNRDCETLWSHQLRAP